MSVYKTKNNLSENTRVAVANLCNARLADAVDLQTQCKQAHWNVKGPTFIALHKLFDHINEQVEEFVDLIAERGVQVGGSVNGTARSAALRSTLPEYPEVSGGREHIEALSSALAAFGSNARAAIKSCDELGDADSADIFTGISRNTDKWLWFVEAHLQSEPPMGARK
jgi:starvation-inducible DNA-binding protein